MNKLCVENLIRHCRECGDLAVVSEGDRGMWATCPIGTYLSSWHGINLKVEVGFIEDLVPDEFREVIIPFVQEIHTTLIHDEDYYSTDDTAASIYDYINEGWADSLTYDELADRIVL